MPQSSKERSYGMSGSDDELHSKGPHYCKDNIQRKTPRTITLAGVNILVY